MNKIPELKLKFEQDDFNNLISTITNGMSYILEPLNEYVIFGNPEYDNECTVHSSDDIQDLINGANLHYNELYLHFLKEADKQGLLTKEASLALKENKE